MSCSRDIDPLHQPWFQRELGVFRNLELICYIINKIHTRGKVAMTHRGLKGAQDELGCFESAAWPWLHYRGAAKSLIS